MTEQIKNISLEFHSKTKIRFCKKVDSILLQTQFTIDYKNKEINFVNAPAQNISINVVSLSGNGEQILDMDVFVGDGSTNSCPNLSRKRRCKLLCNC